LPALLGRTRRRLASWIAWQSYRCLTQRWEGAQRARSALDEPLLPARIRPLERPELRRFARDPAYEVSARFLERLEPRRDLCLAAFVGAELACYGFVSAAPTEIDERLRFHFPRGWLYVYKAFTHPRFRGKRLLSEVFLRGLSFVEDWLGAAGRPLGFVTLVLSGNEASLRAFGRIGFQPAERFAVLRLRCWPYAFAMPGRERSGFFIEKIRSAPGLA